ncbi:G patch domain-containing protein 1 [Spea bombifrons]|uniref:G patch domain-containing protein 1 n=1 Tax=Spea bombifrons TaxID=233779 RepID=UPI00234AE115|nr:G patch domain-containing protein 1 [Spea bombifrons]
MAAQDSDGEEDFVSYGKALELYEEGEQPKKPVPLHDQTVKDEKGRYKRFHGAFTGGFSAGYFNTVGTKEGWAPSTFISSRSGRSEKQTSRPEDFMDDEDLSEFGIAPKEILTTDEFASRTKDRIREKARELASVTAPIPGATILEDLIAPAKISIGIQLLRQMGWKEGQGIGPRTKKRAKKQMPDNVKMYGCALPPTGSEESEDEDEYIPENVTFAPKDVTPVDFTVKDNVHGLGYRGLDPRQALFGGSDMQLNLFGDGADKMSNVLDIRHVKGRKVGISGQAFGVGALEDEDDDIYGTDSMSKYDTVLRDESGDGLFGWTAPKEYKSKKGLPKELQYVDNVLDGFCIATKPTPTKKIFSPPELPRDYRPIHYFRPVLSPNAHSSSALHAMLDSSQKPPNPTKELPPSRHQLNSSQRGEMLGETRLQGPTSVLEMLSDKDQERIRQVKAAAEQQKLKAQSLAQEALKSRFQSVSAPDTPSPPQAGLLGREALPAQAGDFRPFEKNPDKQQRYEIYIRKLHQGEKDALDSSLDTKMTEWERSRERDEFMRSATLYKSTNSMLSSRFTRGKYEEDSDKVEVPRDEEGDLNDKASAVKMKMFGKLTRDTFEWHPDKLLCKRFNIPDPYPGSTMVGLPKVKRDKFSVFNFLTISETPKPIETSTKPEQSQQSSQSKPRKPSRWDLSAGEQKDSVSDFLSRARSEVDVKKEQSATSVSNIMSTAPLPAKVSAEQTDQIQDPEVEEKRPSMDLFKAIFADSSDEKSSEEESEEEEEEPASAVNKPETPLSSVQDPNPVTEAPAPPVVTELKETQESMDACEEFGPRLPPPVLSGGSGKSDHIRVSGIDEPIKKQKQKRNKEKRKVKKERKHKKEKKKKHKKQKHKAKQRSKMADGSSSDSEESSESPSEAEGAAEITPRELLKRLKNLPIPR